MIFVLACIANYVCMLTNTHPQVFAKQEPAWGSENQPLLSAWFSFQLGTAHSFAGFSSEFLFCHAFCSCCIQCLNKGGYNNIMKFNCVNFFPQCPGPVFTRKPTWGPTNTCKNYGARSSLMWCVFSCVFAPGSYVSSLPFTVHHAHWDLTKLGGLDIVQSKVRVLTWHSSFGGNWFKLLKRACGREHLWTKKLWRRKRENNFFSQQKKKKKMCDVRMWPIFIPVWEWMWCNWVLRKRQSQITFTS